MSTKNKSYSIYKNHINHDSEHAWGVHCMIAVHLQDELDLTHEQSNRTAASMLKKIYKVDTSEHKNFLMFEETW